MILQFSFTDSLLEVIRILALELKSIGYVKIKENDYNLNLLQSRFISTNKDLINDKLKYGDPEETKIILNEFNYCLIKKKYELCVYWLSWILNWEKINTKKNKNYICGYREISNVEPKYYTDLVWLIWEILIKETSKLNNENLNTSINLWVSKKQDEAYEKINKANDPQTEVVAFTMYLLLKHKKLTVKLESDIREEVARLSDERITYYSSKLNSLQVIAAIAPLLGLLGTVFGMIEAFQQMEVAGKNVDPSILSGGIWEALLTTAAGLSVAIPIVIFESYFRNLIDRFKSNLENAITKVMTADLN